MSSLSEEIARRSEADAQYPGQVKVVVIREAQGGLVIRKYGRALPGGPLLALKGEAGYQTDLLAPGLHLGLWLWKYTVKKVPLVFV